MSDNVGNAIAAAHTALAPEQAAEVMFKALFETGPNRLPSKMAFMAKAAITGGLIEWRKQILAEIKSDADKWKTAYKDTKEELENLKLRIAILEKEGKL